MPDPIPLELGTRSNKGRFGFEGNARLINCYAEELGPEGKIAFPVYASDGWSSFATLSGGGVRAMLALNNELYVVAGRVLQKIDSGGGVTVLGGVASDGVVTMARNRRSVPQIAVTCDGINQIVSGGTLSVISDADLPAAGSVAHLDGYFVWLLADGRMYASAIDDGTSIDALDFATAEANPDGGVRIVSRGRDLIAFGSKSFEVWSIDASATNFPFSRVTSRDVGCLSAGSVAIVNTKNGGDGVCFVSTNSDGAYAGVRMMVGYDAVVIGTPQIDDLIRNETHPEAILGTSWHDGTHSFYAISGTNWTWVYDATTGLPHERKSYGLERWRASCVTTLGTSLIVGDYSAAQLYQMSRTAYSEAGDPITMVLQPPPVSAYPHALRFDALYLDVIPGTGDNTSGDELDPVVGISYSEDGGATWSNERVHAVGRQGERRTRVKATRLGSSGEDGRQFKFSMSANVAKGLTGASVAVKKLRA